MSKRIKFLKEEIAERSAAIDAIAKEVDKEERARTSEESEKWAGFKAEIKEFKSELKDLEELQADKEERAIAKEAADKAAKLAGAGTSNEGEDKQIDEVRKAYSIGKAFGHQRNHSAYDGVEGEVQAEAERELRLMNKTASGTAIPSSMLSETRTDIDQATSSIQPTEVGAYVKGLRENSVYTKLGVVPMNLTADHKIPIVGKQNVAWVAAENTSAADGGTNFTSKTLVPHWLRSYVDVSNTLLIQNGQGALASVMEDLGRATANTIDAAMWAGSTVTNAPTAIPATASIGTFTEAAAYAANVSIFADLVDAEQTLALAEGIEGRLSYLLSPTLLSDLKKSAQVASVTPGTTNMDYHNSIQNGYPTTYTVAATSATGLFGDFSKIKMGFFGGMDMVLDRYGAPLLADQTRIVLHRHADWALPIGSSFVKWTSLLS